MQLKNSQAIAQNNVVVLIMYEEMDCGIQCVLKNVLSQTVSSPGQPKQSKGICTYTVPSSKNKAFSNLAGKQIIFDTDHKKEILNHKALPTSEENSS